MHPAVASKVEQPERLRRDTPRRVGAEEGEDGPVVVDVDVHVEQIGGRYRGKRVDDVAAAPLAHVDDAFEHGFRLTAPTSTLTS